MKILIIDSEKNAHSTHRLFVDSLPISAELDEVFFAADVLKEQRIERADFIFCLDKTQDPKILGEILRLVHEKYPTKGVLILTEMGLGGLMPASESKNERHFVYEKTIDQKTIALKLVDYYRQLKNISFEYEYEEYTKIRLIYFLRFNRVNYDVYIKISNDKYVKVFKEGDLYSREDILKYKDKGLKHLFVQSSDLENSSQGGQYQILSFEKNLDQNDGANTFASTAEVVQDLVRELGVNDEVINMVDYAVFKIEEELGENQDDLSKRLARFRSRSDYLTDSAYAVSYVACKICSKMNWDSEETRQKLVFASMMHDVFVDDAELAMNLDFGLLKPDKIDAKVFEEYRKHPVKIAELVKKNDKLPMNLEDLVLCHHELPDGSGFPRGLDGFRISQLCAVFNIARAFVNELFRIDFDMELLPGVISGLEKRYKTGNYKFPIEALAQCFPYAQSKIPNQLD